MCEISRCALLCVVLESVDMNENTKPARKKLTFGAILLTCIRYAIGGAAVGWCVATFFIYVSDGENSTGERSLIHYPLTIDYVITAAGAVIGLVCSIVE